MSGYAPARRWRWVGLPLGLAMAGCAVGPNYAAPKSGLAAFHHRAPASASGAAAPPPLDRWWEGFDDPELVTVVQRALRQNIDLEASFARVREARAAAAAAGARLLPALDLEVGATAERQSLVSPLGAAEKALPGYTRNQREYDAGAAASWEIDLAGGLRRRTRAARDEVQAAEADRTGTRITVAADAADAYLLIRGLQARLAEADDQVSTDEHLLELVKIRHRLGAADDREVAQAQALLKQATATVPALRTALDAQLNRLDVLMGVQAGTYASELAQPAGAIPAVPAIGADPAPIDVLRRRPDVIAAERRLAASNERIGAAIADYYPKVSLAGVLGFDSVSYHRLVSANAFQPIGAGQLRWNLFDFGRIDAEVAGARGANSEALAAYRQTVLKATEDVENAFAALAQTGTRLRELQDEVIALTRARDLSQRAYQAGAIALTDVLDADRQLLVARDELDGTRADAARAAVHTFRALGGGWSASPSREVSLAPGGH